MKCRHSVVLFLGLLVGAVFVPTPHTVSAAGERAVILSPYATVATFAAPGQEPNVHAGLGDWAVDVYNGVDDVYPDIVGATGTLSMTATVSDSCGTTGKIVTVSIKVDNVYLGYVNYVHLDDVSLPVDGVVTPATKLGTTRLWTPAVQYDGNPQYLCWSVSSLSGVHVHMAAFGGSCYAGIAGGTAIAHDAEIAAIGQGISAGNRCTASQLVHDGSPPPADADGDGVADSEDSCPVKAGLTGHAGCPAVGGQPLGWGDAALFASAIGDDGHLYYKARRDDTPDPWSAAWTDLERPGAAPLSGTPALLWADGNVFAFAIGTDGHLYSKSRDDDSNAWTTTWFDRGAPLSTDLQGSPAVAWADDNMFVFAIGEDGTMHYISRSNSAGGDPWNGWTELDRPGASALQGSPSANWADGTLFVFAIGADGNLYHKTRSDNQGGDPWATPWFDRGHPGSSALQGSPSANWADGNLFVFAIGADGNLYHKSRNDTDNTTPWTETWFDRGQPGASPLQSSPSAVWADGNLFVFGVGVDGRMYQKARDDDGQWSVAWFDRGRPGAAALKGSPSANWADGNLFVAAIGVDGGLHYTSRSDTVNIGDPWAGSWSARGNPEASLLTSYLLSSPPVDPPPVDPPPVGPTATFVPLVPGRLLETRVGAGSTVDGLFWQLGARGAGSTTELVVAGRGGVPDDAVAVVLNLTVTGPSAGGYLTVFPCGSAQPTASSLNFVAGQTVPNAVIAKVGVGGKVCVFTDAATHLIADVNGYF